MLILPCRVWVALAAISTGQLAPSDSKGSAHRGGDAQHPSGAQWRHRPLRRSRAGGAHYRCRFGADGETGERPALSAAVSASEWRIEDRQEAGCGAPVVIERPLEPASETS